MVMQRPSLGGVLGVLAAVTAAVSLGACSGSDQTADDQAADQAEDHQAADDQPLSPTATSGTENAGTSPRSTIETGVQAEAEVFYDLPSFEGLASRDGLVSVTITAIDVATEHYPIGNFDVHFCDGTISEVLVGDFTAGESIRVSCYASAGEGSTVSPEELAAGAHEAIEAPAVGEDIIVAPIVDLNNPNRFTAERIYSAGDGVIALEPLAFGVPQVPDGSQALGGSTSDEAAARTMGMAAFITLWETTQANG
jgi:hypothetical protein